MATINVKDAAGSTVALEKPLVAGQAAMAASRPVVIASDQSAIPITVASLPSGAVTNAGTFAVQAAATVVGAGTAAAAARVTLASDSPGVTTLGQTTKAASLPVTLASDQGALAVTLTSTTVTGTVAVTESGTWSVNLIPATSGGLTILSTLITSGTNATSVKASAGQLYKAEITNNSANIGYLKLYNTAGTPTAGSGTPVIRLMVPGNASGTGTLSTYDNGVAFATGIGFTFTGGIADADTTSVAASAFIVNLYYK